MEFNTIQTVTIDLTVKVDPYGNFELFFEGRPFEYGLTEKQWADVEAEYEMIKQEQAL